MTRARIAALEKVAGAARRLADVPGIELQAEGAEEAFSALDDALAALDALAAEPEPVAEGVEVALWEEHDGRLFFVRAGGLAAVLPLVMAAERERCARVAEGMPYRERYRTWPWWANPDGSQGNRENESDVVRHADAIAAAIRGDAT